MNVWAGLSFFFSPRPAGGGGAAPRRSCRRWPGVAVGLRMAGAVAIAALGPSSGALGASCPDTVHPEPALVLAQPAQARVRAGAPLRILAIGSSSTAGVGASQPNRNYPAQLAQRLIEALGPGSVEVTNAGVSGESAPATVKRLEQFLAQANKPDLVLWQVGTNDAIFGNTPERLGALVRQGISAAASTQVAILLIDQQYFVSPLKRADYERFVAAVDDVAAAESTPLLPRYAMLKAWAAEDPKGFRDLFWWDRFHMNDAGYACLAQLLAVAVADAVKSARAPTASTSGPAPTGTGGQ